ncbi:hypothetical protein IAR50_004925 [Cryptococcus sp. DSM 104548]
MVGSKIAPADLQAGTCLQRGQSIVGKITACQQQDTPDNPPCLLFTVQTKNSRLMDTGSSGQQNVVDLFTYDIQLYPSMWHPYKAAPLAKKDRTSVKRLLSREVGELRAIAKEKDATIFMVGGMQIRGVLQKSREGALGTEWSVVLRAIGQMQVLKPGRRNGYILKDDPTLPMERFNATETLPSLSRPPAPLARPPDAQTISHHTAASSNTSQSVPTKRVSEWSIPSVKKGRSDFDGQIASGPSRPGSSSTSARSSSSASASAANSVSMRPGGETVALDASPMLELHPDEAEISERLHEDGFPRLRDPLLTPNTYTNLNSLVNGKVVSVIAYISDTDIPKPTSGRDASFTIHLLDATSKPNPDDPTTRSFTSCTIFRPDVAQFEIFQPGAVILLRNVTVQLQPDRNDLLKLRASSGDGKGKGVVIYKGGEEFVFEERTLVGQILEGEKRRMKAMFEWGKRLVKPATKKAPIGEAIQLRPEFASGVNSSGPSVYKSRNKRLLSDIKLGEYIDATVKILHKEIDFKKTIEYYCSDGTEAQHGGYNRNYQNRLFNLPHNAVYVINVPDAHQVEGLEHLEAGNVVTLENVHLTRHRRDGNMVYTWEWKEAGAEDDPMRVKGVKLVRGEMARAVEKRIAALGGDVVVRDVSESKVDDMGAGTGSNIAASGVRNSEMSETASASAPAPAHVSEYRRKRMKPLRDVDIRDYVDATVEILHIDPSSRELYVSDGTVADRPAGTLNFNYNNATFGLPHNAVYVFKVPDWNLAIRGSSNLRVGNVVFLANVNCREHPHGAYAYSWEWREQEVKGRVIEAKGVELVDGNQAKAVKDRIATLREEHKLAAGNGSRGDGGYSFNPVPRRKRRPLREIDVGEYADATVQILEIDEDRFAQTVQLYVSDGTEANRAEPNRNYFGKTFDLPHNAVYVIEIHNLEDAEGSGLVKLGEVVTLPNVHCKEEYRYSWEWKEQQVRGENFRAKRVGRVMEDEARDVIQRIALLRAGTARGQTHHFTSKCPPIHQPAIAVTASPRFNDSQTHILPRDCSHILHTVFRHPVDHPISSLRGIMSTQSKIHETPPRRTIAWAVKVNDENGESGDVLVGAWCNACKQWLGSAEKFLEEQGEGYGKALGCNTCGEGAVEWRYRFWITLSEGSTELAVFCGHEAESYLPSLPPYSPSTNPNDIRRTVNRLVEISAEVTDIILGTTKVSSSKEQRVTPWIDWTVEPYLEKNGRVSAWAVFGMTRGR